MFWKGPSTSLGTPALPRRNGIDGVLGAFSLIELLVVIATLSLLIAILLPALSGARHHARRTACAAHVRQVGVAIHLYAEDFDDTIPFGP
ncbi:MAG TPA: DUF1559 domain-containing protein, partial [Sedimentisphaerales bacterium]|nr:DUF1559 domain-containing protein [Sedimentisphaerales bacterium]